MKLDVSKWSLKLFYLLVATDIFFIILHLIYRYSGLTLNSAFSIEQDGGYAEIFQYVKEYWIALLLGFLAVRQRSFIYILWSLLFVYLLLDDSLNIHEQLGLFISNKLGFTAGIIRARDFGELAVSALVGSFFLISIATAFRFSDRQSKQTSRYLIITLFALALFGIGVDMVHMIIKFPSLQTFLIILEEGGEHIAISIIASLVFLLPDSLQ